MRLDQKPLVLKSEELMLIKAEYPYPLKELASKLNNISFLERRFIRTVNRSLPIHYETTNEQYLEYCLVDNKTLDGLFYILNKHFIKHEIIDVSKQFTQNSLHINEEFKAQVIDYVHHIMDLDAILDRLYQIGRFGLNDFEMFYLERASQGFVKI